MIAMLNSRMPAVWIERSTAANQIKRLEDGTFVTCPVRLAFVNVLRPQQRRRDDEDSNKAENYNCTLLFPPDAETQINNVLWPAWVAACKEKFPRNWGQDGRPFGLHWPLHDCAENQQYSGYTPGLKYMSCNSQFKPQVVDAGVNPIVDESRIYPGVWAIVKMNIYTYENKKKGAGFGLQNIMIIGDDTRLAGGGSDPAKDFAGVSVDAQYDPATAFNGAQNGAGGTPPPPGAIMPPASAVPPPPGAAPPAAGPSFTPPPAAFSAPPAGAPMDYDPMTD